MLSLFNATDDCLAFFLDQSDFEESLVLNTLFQDRIVVHESNFFNSTLLATHVKRARGKPSLFELASRRCLVIPAFRDHQTQSLGHAYEGMRNVYGESFVLLHPEMQPYRDRLIASVDAGLEHAKPIYWSGGPDSLGESYYSLIRQLLQSESPPDYAMDNAEREQVFARIWEEKEWRFECVEEAAHRTKSKGKGGLQRLELLLALSRSLGVDQDRGNFDPKQLISRYEGEKAFRRGGPDAALSVWVTQEQEGLKGERTLRNLLLPGNPDTQRVSGPPRGSIRRRGRRRRVESGASAR